ncbi:pyridoxamine 5'-phosphate oxidase family protein [uncultured Roseovarius sp.]|uniref:pyridoxamine 5'-phosphate oxidase family protein n=1 Tax=uncultured Roseovarius sp. TaxID=293344 RepID=UPI0026104AC5|nr:pyridoxamine 5'-phosphate oxidase family protein [uncultured Roseovarius sp.]
MPHHFADIAFTPSVIKLQELQGSRTSYARMQHQPDAVNQHLTEHEAGFIAARDSFYMATVTETGWPYIQHRGGPLGFMRVLDSRTLGFADFRGNRQYISLGNLSTDDRVSMFFMDYPNRTRLKLFGRARVIDPEDHATLAQLEMPDYRARIERGFLITVEGFDWNCPQHITPRHSAAEVQALTTPLLARIADLEEALMTRPA